MPNKTLVPDKLQGYLLQVKHMLFELISVDDRIVSIEKLDDVAVEADGKVIAEQVKSVTSANNPIAERSSVFWKTLYNWCTYIETGVLPSGAIMRFVVVSNGVVTPGGIQASFMNAHSDDEAKKALADAKEAILRTAQDGSATDMYATLPDSYREYETEIRRKLDYALSYISTDLGKILAQLDVEHPEDPAEFVIKDLTVRVKNQAGRDDYLWEIGSASNWLSYHIALILALHRFFQTKSSVNIPNFIVFDQPSQVYFPRTRYSPDEAELQLNDDDKNAVRKIFESLSTFVKDAGFGIQIIVTEHVDDDIWGNIPDSRIHLVEKWRNNVKLVPVEWLE